MRRQGAGQRQGPEQREREERECGGCLAHCSGPCSRWPRREWVTTTAAYYHYYHRDAGAQLEGPIQV